MSRKPALCSIVLLLLPLCVAEDYSFESVAYDVQTSPNWTVYDCALQIVALKPDLSHLEIMIPYPPGELQPEPLVFVGQTQLDPGISEEGDGSLLSLDMAEMKIGEMANINMRYGVAEGVEVEHGAEVEVRTLGLGGNITIQALNLRLRDGLTVSRIETPDGVIKPNQAGIPLTLSKESVTLVFGIRRTNLLDNRNVVLGLELGVLGVVAGGLIYVWYRRKTSK
jgi:hypothetical protein